MAEPRLRAPLAKLFEQRLPEAVTHRLWLRIEQGSGRRSRASRSPRWPSLSVAVAWAALTACLVLGVAFYVASRAAPLRLANREKVPAALAARLPRTVAFDDGSQVELGRETQLDVLQSTERLFAVALRSGQAFFSVVPGGPRAWRVECGPVSVDVVGTRFLVARGPDFVRVQVERGRVLVSGEGVPDRVARVNANESIVVPFGTTAPGLTGPTDARPPVAALDPTPPSGVAPPPARSAAHRDERSDPEPSRMSEAPAQPGAAPAREPDVVDTLLQQADAARRNADPARAADLLRRIVNEFPRDSRVAISQFTLGRLYLDSLGEPRRAVTHFEHALGSGIPGALAEDAQALLVEARARAGDREGALSAATRYRALYPAGRHLLDVERWVTPSLER